MLYGSSSRIVHHRLPVDDPRRRRPDISKAQELLGWQPKTPLRDGLRHAIDYFEKNSSPADGFPSDEGAFLLIGVGGIE